MTSSTFELSDGNTLSYDIQGHGPAALVLHGGGGPRTVAGLAAHLAETHTVVSPVHPGWEGTVRPDSFTRVADLSETYLALLASLDLSDALVVGSSMGGWVASDMAVRDANAGTGLVGRVVIIDGAGIDVPSEPMPQFFSMTPAEIAEHTFYEPEKFAFDPSTLPPEAAAVQQANMQAMGVYAGDPYMHDPELAGHLGDVTAKTLVLWGEADRVFTPGYGRAYAALIPGARFQLVEKAGHLPQLEQPEVTLGAIDAFVAE